VDKNEARGAFASMELGVVLVKRFNGVATIHVKVVLKARGFQGWENTLYVITCSLLYLRVSKSVSPTTSS
jgi:hypothetical protein